MFICLYVHDPYIIEDPCLKVNLIIESQRYQGLLYWGEGSVPSLGHMGCGGGGVTIFHDKEEKYILQ